MIVIGDTSGLVAAFNPSDPESATARVTLDRAALTVVSPLVLLEIEHIVTRNVGRQAAYRVDDWLLRAEAIGRIELPVIAASTFRRSRSIQERYAALSLDLTDATNVVLAEIYETDAVLTLDRKGFRAITPLTEHPAFRLLPDDL
ncbi:PIN domain-containing protein [Nocardia aurantia]|uniref:Ribonuclease VapC n=1 Tax=Nocardia aurantia TaxID=2585199 RepID=A0A7K0DPG2_9NOCA|nr:PIN domain-containing protein [Nocardia aurantia]MQY27633.1 Ribonuclease VapC26 [Nocardia aurantia]